eukprot:8976898-Alexandrium_andersonii.AAC.1
MVIGVRVSRGLHSPGVAICSRTVIGRACIGRAGVYWLCRLALACDRTSFGMYSAMIDDRCVWSLGGQ